MERSDVTSAWAEQDPDAGRVFVRRGEEEVDKDRTTKSSNRTEDHHALPGVDTAHDQVRMKSINVVDEVTRGSFFQLTSSKHADVSDSRKDCVENSRFSAPGILKVDRSLKSMIQREKSVSLRHPLTHAPRGLKDEAGETASVDMGRPNTAPGRQQCSAIRPRMASDNEASTWNQSVHSRFATVSKKGSRLQSVSRLNPPGDKSSGVVRAKSESAGTSLHRVHSYPLSSRQVSVHKARNEDSRMKRETATQLHKEKNKSQVSGQPHPVTPLSGQPPITNVPRCMNQNARVISSGWSLSKRSKVRSQDTNNMAMEANSQEEVRGTEEKEGSTFRRVKRDKSVTGVRSGSSFIRSQITSENCSDGLELTKGKAKRPGKKKSSTAVGAGQSAVKRNGQTRDSSATKLSTAKKQIEKDQHDTELKTHSESSVKTSSELRQKTMLAQTGFLQSTATKLKPSEKSTSSMSSDTPSNMSPFAFSPIPSHLPSQNFKERKKAGKRASRHTAGERVKKMSRSRRKEKRGEPPARARLTGKADSDRDWLSQKRRKQRPVSSSGASGQRTSKDAAAGETQTGNQEERHRSSAAARYFSDTDIPGDKEFEFKKSKPGDSSIQVSRPSHTDSLGLDTTSSLMTDDILYELPSTSIDVTRTFSSALEDKAKRDNLLQSVKDGPDTFGKLSEVQRLSSFSENSRGEEESETWDDQAVSSMHRHDDSHPDSVHTTSLLRHPSLSGRLLSTDMFFTVSVSPPTQDKDLLQKARRWKKFGISVSPIPTVLAPIEPKVRKNTSQFITCGLPTDSLDDKDVHSYRIYSHVQSLVRKQDQSKFRRRWFRAMRIISNICFLSKVMAKRSYNLTAACPTFMDIGDNAMKDLKLDTDIFIDTGQFKVGGLEGFNMNVEEIATLQSNPQDRTPKQINLAMYNLQFIDSFCDYPLTTQRAIARLGRYTNVGPNRVIVREGHSPGYIYYILSGQAVVSSLVDTPEGQYRQTQAILTKGMMFGDMSIINKSARLATIMTRTDMQLLLINKYDYINIFMPERLLDGIPDYIKYLSKCSWMKTWPVRLLQANPEKCYMRYFRHRHVVVADSTASDNLYVIRNGKCQVLMLIDSIKASWKDLEKLVLQELVDVDQYNFGGPNVNKQTTKTGRKPLSVSDIRSSSFVHPKERTDFLYRGVSGGSRSGRQQSCSWDSVRKCLLQADNVILSHCKREQESSKGSSSDSSSGGTENTREHDTASGEGEEQQQGLNMLQVACPSFRPSSLQVSDLGTLDTAQSDAYQPCPTAVKSTRPARPWSSWDRRRQYKIPDKCRPTRKHIDTPISSPVKEPPVYVEIAALREGDVFGFDQLDLPLCAKLKSHKVSLVSSGAEVIVINKRFFVQHANAEVQQAVHMLTNPYPGRDEVHQACRMQLAWDMYQHKLRNDITSRLDRIHPLRGMYFQPGPLVNPLASVGLIPDTR